MSTTEPTTTNHTLADAPAWAWDRIVEIVCHAQAEAFDRGYAQGVRDAQEDAQAAAVWTQAAQVARNVASDRTRTWAPAGEPQRVGWGWES